MIRSYVVKLNISALIRDRSQEANNKNANRILESVNNRITKFLDRNQVSESYRESTTARMDWFKVAVLIYIVSATTNCDNIKNHRKKLVQCDNGKCISNLTKFHVQNRFLKLVCRDDTTLVVAVQNEYGEVKVGETYMITINTRDESKLPPKKFYLIRKPIITITNLYPETLYSVSADALDGLFQYTARSYFMEFKTLKENYIPNNVTDIYTEDFSLSSSGNGVDVTIWWDPSEERTCSYNILFHSTDSTDEKATVLFHEINNTEEMFRHELKELKFGAKYQIGITAFNRKDPRRKSEIWWHAINVPTCLELLKGNVTLCSPYYPENVKVEVKSTAYNRYKLNVHWDQPASFPNFYTLQLIDYKSQSKQNFYNINGTISSVELSDVEINGLDFELFLTAHSTGGNSSTIYYGQIDHTTINQPSNDDFSTMHIILFVAAPILASLLLLFVKLKLDQHIKSIRAQNGDSHFQELQIKSPNDRTIHEQRFEHLDQIYALQSDFNFKENPMEMDPNSIQTLEIIGEGAFGSVRRAIILPTKQVVAVKMLKNCQSYGNIRNFYREIEVMKSVPSHPNIVGIVGHCTKNIFELMLLTEYCSEGNLLDYLRNIYDDKPIYENDSKLTPRHANFPFQIKKKACEELKEGSLFSCTTPPKINIAENSGTGFEIKMSIIENHGYGFDIGNNHVKHEITEIDLISFAYQVANGMDFLAENKVVHRDLACRNVLVLPDRRVKISDFGLSRDVYQKNLYKTCGKEMLPIKWLAIESMTHQIYSTYSDVWSFGILLYEIVTKGEVPYPTVDTSGILNFLKNGGRMDRPNGCRADVYKLMLSCWNIVPTERPSFKSIKNKLTQILGEMQEK
ncbi:Tyrosine-protein kinase receptor torso [Pseudolycoriella hygida]|uniref:receptor protein-tyrosine kinase n=1 Tax=Pseudolycoriella hygida TaxID=35572 RepID=A0A9Q0RWV9_9DIPT|nr:Tyrosine-protein kinase receptor torso [Pseudolycoriella hygida]